MVIGRSMTLEDAGKLLVRVLVGGLMLFHGIDKVMRGVETGTALAVAMLGAGRYSLRRGTGRLD